VILGQLKQARLLDFRPMTALSYSPRPGASIRRGNWAFGFHGERLAPDLESKHFWRSEACSLPTEPKLRMMIVRLFEWRF